MGFLNTLPVVCQAALPGDGGNHAVLKARGERVRPLAQRLVGDADSLGCGCHTAAKQFNRFRLLHLRTLTAVQYFLQLQFIVSMR